MAYRALIRKTTNVDDLRLERIEKKLDQMGKADDLDRFFTTYAAV